MPLLTAGPSRLLGRRTTAAAAWWQVAGKTCVAAYQPKGAADLATSYVNLANPGTNDAAPGSAPTFAAATGWTFDGSGQYLTTGIIPAAGYTLIVRFSNATRDASNRTFAGSQNAGPTERFYVRSVNATSLGYGYAGSSASYTSSATSGVMALAGVSGYLDGGAVASVTPGGTVSGYAIDIGRINSASPAQYAAVKIQAVAIYSGTLDATQVATVSAAMAAL